VRVDRFFLNRDRRRIHSGKRVRLARRKKHHNSSSAFMSIPFAVMRISLFLDVSDAVLDEGLEMLVKDCFRPVSEHLLDLSGTAPHRVSDFL